MGTLNTIASVAGAAASGPLSVVGIIGSLVSKALDFIPDPQKKLELQSHGLDLQAQAQAQELDAMTKQVQASAAAQADAHLSRIRSWFCLVICAAILYNMILVSLLNGWFHLGLVPQNIPTNLLVIFAVIMLGLVGVPSALAMVKDVMGMPGDSQVSIMGVKVANKS